MRSHGETPLQAALGTDTPREPAVIEVLLAAGADPGMTDSNGWTPLHHAAYDARGAKIIRLLLAAGAVVDALTCVNHHCVGLRTPLHLAVSSHAEGMCVFLRNNTVLFMN